MIATSGKLLQSVDNNRRRIGVTLVSGKGEKWRNIVTLDT